METNVVMVKLWGMQVGYLSWDKKTNAAIFEYEPEFLDKGLDIAPLTMSINTARSKKQKSWTENKDKLYMGLPPMIADSLPDKWGYSLFKAWRRDSHISTNKVTPVDPLSFIGSRAMGALVEDITRQDLEVIAQWNDIQDYKSLIDMVSTAICKFKEYANELNVNLHLINDIESDFINL